MAKMRAVAVASRACRHSLPLFNDSFPLITVGPSLVRWCKKAPTSKKKENVIKNTRNLFFLQLELFCAVSFFLRSFPTSIYVEHTKSFFFAVGAVLCGCAIEPEKKKKP